VAEEARKEGTIMRSFFESGPLPSWKEISQWLGKDLPLKDIPWKELKEWYRADGEWMEQLLKRLFRDEQASGASSQDRPREIASSAVQLDAVQHDKKLTVSVRLPPGTDMRSLRLFATADRLRVTGLPGQKTRFLRFPCRVYPRTGRAVQKGNRIIVQFGRRPDSREEVELFIRS
jgi:hypothetical protein